MRYRATAAALAGFFLFAWLAFAYPRTGATSTSPVAPSTQEEQQHRSPPAPRRRGARTTARAAIPRVDYSNFSHRTEQHRRACDSCHTFPSSNWKEVRKGEAAFPDVTEYPRHASCTGCHQQQFFSGAQPVICSVCHTNISPRNHVRFPFPSLGETFYASKKGQNFASDFQVNFPHDKHVELVGSAQPGLDTSSGVRFVRASFRQEGNAAQADKSCNVCHQTYQPQGNSAEEYATPPPQNLGEAFWLKKGTFKTLPATHTTCFTCHSQDSGVEPAPNACNACHKLRASAESLPADFDPKLAATMNVADNLLLMTWRKRHSAGAFRHEGGMHPDQSCTACHQITTMNTLDEKTLRVPILSCGGCHIGASADEGALNFEVEKRKTDAAFQCVKCHVRFGREPVPESHLKAIAAAK
ncbi:MAG TPA: cytochrome c3 family protein [Pyrinomonadaceae bacterium]|jgi:hypothetical protein